MKQRTKKLVSMLIVGTMAVSMLAGCGQKRRLVLISRRKKKAQR